MTTINSKTIKANVARINAIMDRRFTTTDTKECPLTHDYCDRDTCTGCPCMDDMVSEAKVEVRVPTIEVKDSDGNYVMVELSSVLGEIASLIGRNTDAKVREMKTTGAWKHLHKTLMDESTFRK